jgi:hypothetical protein
MIWEYDFGDSWTHELRLHATLDETVPRPRLVAGKRACPPEDCGGPPGYERLLHALADPDHPQHAEFSNLVGREFDPDAFDVARHDRRLERLSRCWWGELRDRSIPEARQERGAGTGPE